MDALEIAEYTIEYIESLDNGQRAELIDGQIYFMGSPGTNHQRLVMRLSNKIFSYIESNNGECEVFPAPFAVYLNEDNRNYVEPDISVICNPNKLNEKGCNGAPDWIIEIVSPGSKHMDYFVKLFKYRSAGVREYWIVDIIKEQVMVYDFVNETGEEYSFDDEIPVGIYHQDLKIRVR